MAEKKTTKKEPTNKKKRVRSKPGSRSRTKVRKDVVKAELASKETKVEEAKKKQPKQINRRSDWRENHAKVLNAFLSLLKTYQRKPTYDELASATGLSPKAVYNHLISDELSETVEDLKILTGQVLMGIYSAAMEGKAQSQRLWLEVVEGWTPKNLGLNVNLNVENQAVIILPQNNREDKTVEVQGWSQEDWDKLNEEQNKKDPL